MCVNKYGYTASSLIIAPSKGSLQRGHWVPSHWFPASDSGRRLVQYHWIKCARLPSAWRNIRRPFRPPHRASALFQKVDVAEVRTFATLKQEKVRKMSESLQLRGTLLGHNGWVTQIATNPKYPDLILSSSRGENFFIGYVSRCFSCWNVAVIFEFLVKYEPSAFEYERIDFLECVSIRWQLYFSLIYFDCVFFA